MKISWKKVWHFIWEEDSVWSWIVNIILAFLLIKFVVFPGLGWMLGTSHPVVAVVSESMTHPGSFEEWWEQSKHWYEANGITRESFETYTLKNGFNKGDIIVLNRAGEDNIEIGTIIVFQTKKPDPIIHRVVHRWEENDQTYYQTKGDNYETNPQPIKNVLIDETRIEQEQIIGKAVVKIPLLGYIKIWFVDIIMFVRSFF